MGQGHQRVITSGRQEDQGQRRRCEDRSRGWGDVLEAGGWGLKPRKEGGLEKLE